MQLARILFGSGLVAVAGFLLSLGDLICGIFAVHIAFTGLGVICRGPRLLRFGILGLIMVTLTSMAAWRACGTTEVMRWSKWISFTCDQLATELEKHKPAGNAMVLNLTDEVMEAYVWKQGPDGTITDRNGEKIQLRPNGSECDLIWLGRDGRTGGAGLDADLEFDRETRSFESVQLPFHQFLFEAPGSSGVGTALLLASVVTFAALVEMQRTEVSSLSWREVLWLAIGSSTVAIVLAAVLTQVSQSGH